MNKKPVTLIILDGYGKSDKVEGNAIAAAKTPNMDRLLANCPNTTIHASGMDVGLPDGQMGNSEVGHTNIGAGRVVYQELTRITKSISDGDFFENEALCRAMEHCKNGGHALHLLGLLSDGGVHSHNTHLYALVEMAKRFGLTKIYVHGFLDGRDVPPSSGASFVKALYEELQKIGVGKIATVMGRYFAMDRDNRWDRVEKAYRAMVLGEGVQCECPYDAVLNSYKEEVTDEFVLPTVVCENGAPVGKISADDAVIFFNFRPDRAREITRALVDPDFDGFDRENGYFPLHYVCMTQYDKGMPNVDVAFRPESLDNTFGSYISKKGLRQLRIAETEKYAHVTFFFNGGVEQPYEREERILIPSPKVATYDLKPEMSAYEVTEAVVAEIKKEAFDVIVLNFANCDMVGHTGDFDAAVAAVEAVDTCVGRVVEAIESVDGIALITADHGNADQMIDEVNGGAFTAHTTNVVPLILVGIDREVKSGRLADLAPTLLDLMGLEKPAEMSGQSLLA